MVCIVSQVGLSFKKLIKNKKIIAYVNIKEVLPTFEHPNVITIIKKILF